LTGPDIPISRAAWNRSALDLESDEAVAQILDRGELQAWRALYARARADADLRRRIRRLVLAVPLPLPRFWLAALASLGEEVEFDVQVPGYYERGGV
jgi:hypothetical protein